MFSIGVLTRATGSLLRVAAMLRNSTWEFPFIASKISISVGMGMSCRSHKQTNIWVFESALSLESVSRDRTDLDVVEVDLYQAAVIVVDPLQGLLHVGGVGGFLWEDLEWIWFHNTWRAQRRPQKMCFSVWMKRISERPHVLLMPSVLAMVPVVPRAS